MKKHIEFNHHTYMGEESYHLDDVDFEPMHDLAYQYCAEDDTYYSLIKPEEVLSIIKQLNNKRRVNWNFPYHLGNTASDLAIVNAAIENDAISTMSTEDGELFIQGVAAQYYEFKNTEIAEALVMLAYTKWDEPKDMLRAFNKFTQTSRFNDNELEWLKGVLRQFKTEQSNSNGANYRYWITTPDYVHCNHTQSLEEILVGALNGPPSDYEDLEVVSADETITITYIDHEGPKRHVISKRCCDVAAFLSNLEDSLFWGFKYEIMNLETRHE